MADPVHFHNKGQGKLAHAYAMEACGGPEV